LETFLTQIGITLPLTPDPPVICFWKWIGWKDYEVPKNRNLESVSAKKLIILHPPHVYPPPVPAGPTPSENLNPYVYLRRYPTSRTSRRPSTPRRGHASPAQVVVVETGQAACPIRVGMREEAVMAAPTARSSSPKRVRPPAPSASGCVRRQ
jgi:hypothetical protein